MNKIKFILIIMFISVIIYGVDTKIVYFDTDKIIFQNQEYNENGSEILYDGEIMEKSFLSTDKSNVFYINNLKFTKFPTLEYIANYDTFEDFLTSLPDEKSIQTIEKSNINWIGKNEAYITSFKEEDGMLMYIMHYGIEKKDEILIYSFISVHYAHRSQSAKNKWKNQLKENEKKILQDLKKIQYYPDNQI